MYTLYIDADSLIYRAALGALRDEAMEFSSYDIIDSEAVLSPKQKEQKTHVAFCNLKKVIYDICAKVVEGRTHEDIVTGVKDIEAIYLLMGSKGNFRKNITLKHRENIYKRNRKLKAPPEGLYELINYITSRPLENSMDRHISHGVFYQTLQREMIEADDLIGICATEDPTEGWLCYEDKDLLQIPHQNHMNYRTYERYSVSPVEAVFSILRQLVIGDSADNIKGIPRAGVKQAEMMEAMSMGNPVSMFNQIKVRYAKAFGDDWEEELAHNIRLLRVLRTTDEIQLALKPYIPPTNVISDFLDTLTTAKENTNGTD